MPKTKLKIALIILLTLIAIVTIIILPRGWEYYKHERKAKELLEKCKELEIDMTSEEVIEIMGESPRVIESEFRGRMVEILIFTSPRRSSETTHCYVDKESGLVIMVNCADTD